MPNLDFIHAREWCFKDFNGKWARHLHFANMEALAAAIKNEVPSDVYYSAAYYEQPTAARMKDKGWLGADLAFDIDADHIPTSCNKIHDEWVCQKCGFSGAGIVPAMCPMCDSVKFSTDNWICGQCIDGARRETLKLLDLLADDLGLKYEDKQVRIFFSGNRGFHVYVLNEEVRKLDVAARKEIRDYLMGIGLRLGGENEFCLEGTSWRERVKVGMGSFMRRATEDDLKEIGLSASVARIVIANRAKFLEMCVENGYWDSIKGVGRESWMKIATHVKQAQQVALDTLVTGNATGVLHAENTLHGKSGLLKLELTKEQLREFDPFEDAHPSSSKLVKLHVTGIPNTGIEDEDIEVPEWWAVYLCLKGKVTEVYEN